MELTKQEKLYLASVIKEFLAYEQEKPNPSSRTINVLEGINKKLLKSSPLLRKLYDNKSH